MILVYSDSVARLYHGESERLGEILEPDSVDAIVTDPPAGIGFMGKEWDSDKGGRDKWIAWLAELFRPAVRALKPGGHAAVWAIPRTSHWTATGLEDAGLEVRDIILHLFGTGFPKSLDISKAIDRELGVERRIVGERRGTATRSFGGDPNGKGLGPTVAISEPGSPEAARWQGFGTALKPAAEHWIIARKPLAGTYADNVRRHGTGVLNVDACRIGPRDRTDYGLAAATRSQGATYGAPSTSADFDASLGRWPAHVTLSHAIECVPIAGGEAYACAPWCAVRMLDTQSGISKSGRQTGPRGRRPAGFVDTASAKGDPRPNGTQYGDVGGASRFFYVAKPTRTERDAGLEHLPVKSGGEATGREDGSAGTQNPRAGAGRGGGARNFHPTVKPIALMRWITRLITPPGGVVLDPFAGSGTTGIAAIEEGFRFLGVERDADYIPILTGRIKHARENDFG